MIDIGKILKRAWHTLWNYRVLWIFGILLALTAGAASSGGSNSSWRYAMNRDNNPPPAQDFQWDAPTLREFNQWAEQNIDPIIRNPDKFVSTIIWISVGVFLFILLMSAIAAVIRYVSETAVIRMVDEYEQSGIKLSFKQGWKLGWDRRAWRLFLINLLINLPVVGLFLVLGLLGWGIYLSVVSGVEWITVTGIIACIGLAFLLIFLVSIGMILLNWLRHFFWRVTTLEDLGVREAFKRGFGLVKRNWQSAGLMWLVMFGLGIAYFTASFIIFLVLIPVYVVMAISGVIVALIPGLIAYGIASLFTVWPLALIIGVIFALPFFLTVTFSPLALIGGWVHVFTSSTWTLTYREIKAMDHPETASPEPVAVE